MPSDTPANHRSRARAAHIGVAVDALRRVVRALRVAAQRTQVDTGVSAAQLFVLRQLSHKPASSMTELSVRTLTDRSSVADVVEKLAERGLVRRSPSADDRRRTTITITLAGRGVLSRAPSAPTSLIIDALHRLDDAELESLADGLVRLTSAMGIEGEPARMLFEDESR